MTFTRMKITQPGRRARRRPPRRSHPIAVAVSSALLLLGLLLLPAAPASAGASNHGEPEIRINPGGGVQTDGSDGVMMVINNSDGQDQVHYKNTTQYCCSAVAPMLNIGGTLYGEAGPAYSSTSWTDLTIVSTDGSTTTTTGGTDIGSGSVALRYTAVHGGLTYLVDRTVSYTHPNNFVTDELEVTIPAGNTETVKLYHGGDTAPGSSDSGQGVMVTSPVRTVYSVNPSSEIQVGYGEIPGETAFDGALSGSYSAPYATVQAGGDIGFGVTETTHDAGLMVQWTIGTEAGVHERAMRTYVGARGASLSYTLSAATTGVDEPVDLNLQILNTASTTETGMGYTFDLPSGVVLGSAAPANSCGGTLTATAGASVVSLADVSVDAAGSCVVTVPVQSGTPGSYEFSSASVSAVSGLENLAGTTTLEVTGESSAPEGLCPGLQGWAVVSDQIERLYTSLMGRSADSDGLLYWTRLRLSGLSANELTDFFLASSERMANHGQLSDEAFVARLYQDSLGRMPESDGKAYWVEQLARGFSRSGLVLAISDSTESVNRTGTLAALTDEEATVCRLYKTLLNRSPDVGGFGYWSSLMAAGLPAVHVAEAILAQPEAAALGQLQTTDFIDHLYVHSALNRSADSTGLNYWSTQAGSWGRGQVAVWLASQLETTVS